MLEAMVSRLYGHSSSSGAKRVENEPDPIEMFERKLLQSGVLVQEQLELIRQEAEAEADAAAEQAMQEPRPKPSDVERFTYAPSPVDVIYPEDYTGLPR
jgi:2-oxoisovalerate dehydrogenase E1 component alpha subunit